MLAYLQKAASLQLIDLQTAQDIVQFGASTGEETIVLAALAEQNGGTVTALEIDEGRGRELKRSRILPRENVYVGDGITYLKNMRKRGQTADLVVAPLLTWIGSEGVTRDLIEAAEPVLPHGALLITSDIDVMPVVRGVFDEKDIAYTTFTAGPDMRST